MSAERVPLVLIAAVARNGVIGVRDSLPWRLPGDLRHFKAATMGRPLIMGRRTFDSIGKPLPGRLTVVVSRDPAFKPPPGVTLSRSPERAVADGQALAARHDAPEVMVAGGGALYAALMDRADRLLITAVDLAPEGDTLFPAIDPGRWGEVSRQGPQQGPGDQAPFFITQYERRLP